jgi:hypothetical protein
MINDKRLMMISIAVVIVLAIVFIGVVLWEAAVPGMGVGFGGAAASG